ncbi:MAG: hypothetical protein WDN45_02855 [Caulobacteraceae bacterium]
MFAHLTSRALIAVSGADARPWLGNLLSNAVEDLKPGEARAALLLTPPGQISVRSVRDRARAGRAAGHPAAGRAGGPARGPDPAPECVSPALQGAGGAGGGGHLGRVGR